jgi:hypothetical protein
MFTQTVILSHIWNLTAQTQYVNFCSHRVSSCLATTARVYKSMEVMVIIMSEDV